MFFRTKSMLELLMQLVSLLFQKIQMFQLVRMRRYPLRYFFVDEIMDLSPFILDFVFNRSIRIVGRG